MLTILIITNSIAVIALLLFIRANRSSHIDNKIFLKKKDVEMKRMEFESLERYENLMKLINLILDKTWNK